jgi:toxin-antitoxin system PIN domain toxin
MKVSLLDVNLLIALAWPSHIHHRDAQAWFSRNVAGGWATCPLTQCAFVRISANRKIIPEAVTPKEALALLDKMVSLETHTFWKDDVTILDKHIPLTLLVGHRQVTDAYLLGLALHHDGQLVTFDGGILDLLPSNSSHRKALQIIEPRLI